MSKSKPSLLFSVAFLILLFLVGRTPAAELTRRPIPDESFYIACRLLNEGDPDNAKKVLNESLANAVKVGSVRWIDSICYYAMYGEALYISGNIEEALQAWDAAIDIYLNNKDWLGRVNYLYAADSKPRVATPWGPGDRPVAVGVFPSEATIVIGDVLTDQRLKQGGLIVKQEMHRINPVAIIQSIALSIRRRNEILGPIAPLDPRSSEILACFSTRSVTPNHWSVTWLDVLFGLALQGTGKLPEAENILTKSLLMNGQFDHALTASALLALGDIYTNENKPGEAATCFLEASVAAYQYGEIRETTEGIEKFFQIQHYNTLVVAPDILNEALKWAGNTRGVGPIKLILLLATAENDLLMGNPTDARKKLASVESLIRSAKLGNSRWADQFNRLKAILLYQQGESDPARNALAAALEGTQHHSLRIYQTQRLGTLIHNNTWNIPPRVFCELYEQLLRFSNELDWTAFPLDTLAFESMIGSEPFEAWFLLLIERNLPDQALEIAERARQVRYYQSLDCGGRGLALRILLETPEMELSEELRTMRRGIIETFGGYSDAANQAAQLTDSLVRVPFPPTNNQEREQYEQLWETAVERENLIQAIVPQRIFVPSIYPQIYTTADIQAGIPEGGTILTFFCAGGDLYGFMITSGMFEEWRVGSVSQVAGATSDFLKTIGVDGKKERPLKDLTNEGWKKPGKDLLIDLLGGASAQGDRFRVQFRRLAIIPDGPLWYLPFEALTLPKGDDLIPLAQVDDLTISYAPTISLTFALSQQESKGLFSENGIVPGVIFPRERSERNEAAVARIANALSKSVVISDFGLDLPSTATVFRFNRLIVLNEIDATKDWGFYFTGKTRDESIHQWNYLPWGAPQQIILPAYRTLGEVGLKNGGDGSEIFLPLMTMMARGAHSVLLSRWRTGGRSSYDLSEQFLTQQNPETPPELAWHQTLNQFFTQNLVLDEEPRIKGTKGDYLGTYPFLWGGYLLAHRAFPVKVSDELNEEEDPEGVEGEGPQNEEANEGEETVAPESETEEAEKPKETSTATAEEPKQPKKNAEEKTNGDKPQEKPEVKEKPKALSPITDEDLEQADQDADDFYSPDK